MVRTALLIALRVRLRPACLPATRATTPIFCHVEALLTASILTVSDAMMTRLCGREMFRRKSSESFKLVDKDRGEPVDPQLKQLMKELGDAINESLSDSEQISEVVARIKEGGYDIFLVLEATIGVSKQGEKPSDKTSLVTTLSTNPEFKINDQDLKFLKSLRIKIEEEKKDKTE